jgi:hypothetical protein
LFAKNPTAHDFFTN